MDSLKVLRQWCADAPPGHQRDAVMHMTTVEAFIVVRQAVDNLQRHHRIALSSWMFTDNVGQELHAIVTRELRITADAFARYVDNAQAKAKDTAEAAGLVMKSGPEYFAAVHETAAKVRTWPAWKTGAPIEREDSDGMGNAESTEV